ncbi:MAG: tRNA lysidine(34) synthetase TilS [Planctomycetota bacterium]|nr:tRNA lysidine(34) synthetase TilS [Planctomycetota bacterium]
MPPAHPAPDRAPLGRREVAPIVDAWRALTGGARVRDTHRRTLVALSAGADSSALLLALAVGAWSHRGSLVAAHIIHDLRPRRESLADARAAERLAQRLRIAFVRAEVRVRNQKGNAEELARRARLAELLRLALAHDCAFIATGHHAGDQLETVLLRLIQGSGPRALGGIAPSRVIHREPPVRLIRPLLTTPRAQLESLCRQARVRWRTDATNADLSRARALLRAKVLPVLRTLSPNADANAAASARRLRRAGVALEHLAARIPARRTKDVITARRTHLAEAPAPVLAAWLRRCVAHAPGARRINARAISAAVRAIRDGQGGTRELRLGPAILRLTRDIVRIRLAPRPSQGPHE